MSDVRKKLHSYQASASAFGGRLQRPIEQHLPVLASSALPVVGGYTSARERDFNLHEIFSIKSAYTQVGGSFDSNTESWTTIATSVVTGLEVNNVLFADRIVAQISVAHRIGSYHPKVSFIGTQFSGLRVGDCRLNPTLNLGLCDVEDADGFPTVSRLKNKQFTAAAQERSLGFADFWLKAGPDGKPLRGMEHLSEDGVNAEADVEGRGTVLASLVDEIEGECGGTKYGHAIYIPDFGRVFLAELTVGHGWFDLAMLRLDLGSPVEGQVSAAHATAGGTGPHGSGGGTNSGP